MQRGQREVTMEFKYILDHEGKPHRRFFEEICTFPHESFKEKPLSDYIVAFAKERGLWVYQDEIWNVIVKKPASPGYEDHPPVMIQGHIDMVCEKTADSVHNFDTDPLELYVENGWLKAKDTTLGADCGHGIAYMLAVLDDKTLAHPPLECYFSVQEEAGIGGPRHVDYSLFTAKRLISTDCMWEGATVISTTYVVGGDFYKRISFEENSLPTYAIKVEGLWGGHAAVNAGRDQANAIKVAARVLAAIDQELRIHLVHIKGGTIRNNIPIECTALFACEEGNLDRIQEITATIMEAERLEHAISDPELVISAAEMEPAVARMDSISSQTVIDLLRVIPTSTHMRSLEVENLVLTSRNMGYVRIEGDQLMFGYLFRSALKTQIQDLMDQTRILAGQFGATFVEHHQYAGYTSPKDNYMNRVWAEVYREATGKELIYQSIHAGTDVGTIVEGMGGMDVTVIGPHTLKFHKPGEALELASFDRTYEYLKMILARL